MRGLWWKDLTVSHATPAVRRRFLELNFLRYSCEASFMEAPCPGLGSTYQAQGLGSSGSFCPYLTRCDVLSAMPMWWACRVCGGSFA